jgi:hypothetical protein
MWTSAIVLELFVVTTFKLSINLFTNPCPIYSNTLISMIKLYDHERIITIHMYVII